MSEQRIDCYAVFLGDDVQDTYTLSRHAIDHAKALGNTARWMRLVEIRDGDTIMSQATRDMNLALAREQINAAIERAEKAEHELIEMAVRAEKAETQLDATIRSEEETNKFARAWAERAKNAESQLNDERGRFERETAAKLIGQNRYDWNNDNRVYTIETKTAIDEARQLADHYFGAKEAKGDE